jgi:autotransporter-associated beta strand protein
MSQVRCLPQRRGKSRSLLLAATAAASLLGSAAPAAFAIDYTWDTAPAGNAVAGGGGSWDTATQNWTTDSGTSKTLWGNLNTDKAIFGDTGGSVTVDGAITANALQFDVTGYTVAPGSGTLTLAGTTPTITVTNAADSATISAIIAGTTLRKSGAGTLILSGTNTYTGATTIAGGTLSISADGNLGTAPGAATAGSLTLTGGTLATTATMTLASNRGIALGTGGGTINAATGTTLTYGGIIAGANLLTKSGSGTLVLSGTNTYSAGLTITDGSVSVAAESNLGTGGITLNGGTFTYTGVASTPTAKSKMTVGAAGGTYNLSANVKITASLASLFSGSGTLTRTGTVNNLANNLSITGSNTSFTGAWIFTGGVTEVSSSNSLGNGSATNTLTLSGGELSPSATTVNQPVFITSGTLSGDNGTSTYAGPITVNGAFNIRLGDFYRASVFNNLIISGNITGTASFGYYNGNNTTVATGGIGQTLFLNGTNSGYSPNNGTTGLNIPAGIIVSFGSPASIPASGVSVNGAATFTLGGIGVGYVPASQSALPTLNTNATSTFGAVFEINVANFDKPLDLGTLYGTSTSPTGGTNGLWYLGSGSAGTYTAATLGASNGTYRLGGGYGSLTITNGVLVGNAAVIIGGATANLVGSNGTGTVTLQAANSYTGATTINLGHSLIITDGSALGSSATGTTIAQGGNLSFSGGITIAEPLTINGASGAASISNYANSLVNISGSNTLTGDITIASLTGGNARISNTAGTLTISGDVTYSGASSGNGYVIAGAAAVTHTSTSTISGSMVFFDTNTSTVTLSGINTFTGSTNLQNISGTTVGALVVNSLNSVVGGTASSSLGAPTTVANGTIQFGTTTLGGSLTYNGPGETTDRVINLQGTSGSAVITQSGTGLLKFTSNVTNTGIGAKSITLQGSTAGQGEIAGIITDSTGTTTKTLNATFASGATSVKLNDSSLNYAAGATISGTGIGAGTLVTAVTNASSVDTVTISPAATGASGAVTTTSYTLSGGATSIIKAGTGTWRLTGDNTYTGTTTINGGNLVIDTLNNDGGGATSLGNPTTATAGTISIGSTTTAGTLTYIGTGSTSNRVINLAGTTGGVTIDNSGTGTFSLTSALTAGGAGIKTLTLTGSTSGIGTLGGAVVDNSATNTTAVTKTGSGTWILGGISTYTGATTVNNGVLRVNGSTASGSAVTVNGGGFLGGTGTVGGAVTVAVNGGTDLRDGAVGTLTLSSTLTFNGVAATPNNLYFELGSASVDKIAATGAVTAANASGALISFNQLTGTPIPDGTYPLITSAATSVITGFSLATTQSGGRTYSLTTQTGAGNVVQVNIGTATTGAPATAVWGGTTANATWTTAGNWYTDDTNATPTGAVPGVGSNVSFYTANPTAANLDTVTLGADFEINSLTFSSTATTPVTIGGGASNALTIDAGISQLAAATHTISARVGIGASQTWTVAAGGGLTLSGLVFDTGPGFTLTKAGAGILTLSGTGNTFSGDINVTGGVLAFAGSAGGNGDPLSLGAGSKTITVTNNAILRPTTNSNPTSVNTKKFVVGAGGATFDPQAGVTFQLDDALQFSGTGDLTVTSSSATPSGIVYLNNQAYQFSGNVIINSGTLRIGTNSVLGTTAGRTITVNAAGTLDTNTNLTLVNVPLSIALNGGTISATTANGTFPHNLPMTANSSVSAGANFFETLSGNITGAFNLTKNGAGVTVISGTNTYGAATGAATTITAGALQATKTASLPSYATAGQVAVQSGGALYLNVGGAGEFTLADVANFLSNGTFANNSGIGFDTTNTPGGTLTVPNIAVTNPSGVTTFSLGKLGTGTLALPNANAFGAGSTTIYNGTVSVQSGVDNSLGTGPLQLGTRNSANVGNLDLGTTSQNVTTITIFTASATPNTITIGAGETLTASGVVNIGLDNGASPQTRLTVTGATGTFSIGTAATPTNANMSLGLNATTNVSNGVTVDLSGVGTFFANLGTGTLRVGDPTNSGGTATLASSLILAPTSTIKATTLTSESPDSAVTEVIKLGSVTNTINANSIIIGGSNGSNRSSGTLTFNSGTGTLTVRNLAGTGRASLDVGYGSATTTATMAAHAVDLTGHSVDLLLSTLNIAGRTGSNGGITTATFAMDTGTLDVTGMTIGNRAGTSTTATGAVTGTFTFGGGTATVGASGINIAPNSSTVSAGTNNAVGTVNINGGAMTIVGAGVTLGSASTAAELSNATLNVNGGSLTVGAPIVRGTNTGTVTSTLSLNGGTLNMAGFNIGTAAATVNATFQSGTLTSLLQFNGGAPFAKSGDGTLIITGTNAYSGATTVAAGTSANSSKLIVNGTLSNTASVTVAQNALLGGSGNISSAVPVTVNGTLAPGNSPGILTIAGPLTLSSTSTYSVEIGGATPGNNNNNYDQTITTASASNSIVLGGGALSVVGFNNYATTDLTSDPTKAAFILVQAGNNPVSGTFAGLPIDGSPVTFADGGTAQITYTANFEANSLSGGNDVALYNITLAPEPGTIGLLGFAALGLLARRRRRIA